MIVLEQAELIRIKANKAIDPKVKSSLGQFFTPKPISLYMASLFKNMGGNINLLDPGCGPGSLTAGFVDEAIKRKELNSISVVAYDIDPIMECFIKDTLKSCNDLTKNHNIHSKTKFILDDFIITNALKSQPLKEQFTHVIINPPYKKILATSDHRKALQILGIDNVNIYTGFVALAIKLLKRGGELVTIIPRSFCNGPYYQSFREFILKETAIKHIHVFDSRSNAFSEDKVLQENVILHLIKGGQQGDVTITSSPSADFSIDEESQTITATDKTSRVVGFNSIVLENDNQKFIHISANERDQRVINQLSGFRSSLDDLGVGVSTGPIVDFRLKNDLRRNLEKGSVPLIYPIHLNNGVDWPKVSKKANAINISNGSRSWLWKNEGFFIIVRRFSSKEEKRRIVASVYNGKLPGKLIGFENKLNVIHNNKTGFNRSLAYGLFVYLNCSLLDKYYRLFGGHTQVNATDLRTIKYPSIEVLESIGSKIKNIKLSQKQIDYLIEEELIRMNENTENNPIKAQEKIDQALEVIEQLGMPKAQQNERSALTLLALLNLKPDGSWKNIEKALIGVTPIMDWCREVYGKNYAPNSRETFRRKTLHQFVDGGICLYNPDQPDRPVNSPKACYEIAPEIFEVLTLYESSKWKSKLDHWIKDRSTLVEQYAKKREMEKIPLKLDDGTEIKLSPGEHSQLIHDIVIEFGPRFAAGATVVYMGDTGAKSDYFKKEILEKLGVKLNKKGKLPDVILYLKKKNWLFLIESVTSHGPVDGKRYDELVNLFSGSKAGLVFVTALPSRELMRKYLPDISWETEVWTADSPTHMIHFNGDRFLGPHR